MPQDLKQSSIPTRVYVESRMRECLRGTRATVPASEDDSSNATTNLIKSSTECVCGERVNEREREKEGGAGRKRRRHYSHRETFRSFNSTDALCHCCERNVRNDVARRARRLLKLFFYIPRIYTFILAGFSAPLRRVWMCLSRHFREDLL